MNMKNLLLLVITALAALPSAAQQNGQYSQYMFDHLAVNPAFAGTKDVLNITLSSSKQWTGFKGAPALSALSGHMPFRKMHAGAGLEIISDRIGPRSVTGALGTYTYKVRLGAGKLSMGLRLGAYSYDYNWSKIDFIDQGDNIYTGPEKKVVSTGDFGLYYYTRTLYAGASASHLNGDMLLPSSTGRIEDPSRLQPHIYLAGGKVWKVKQGLLINPSLLMMYTKATPLTIDINCNALVEEKLWLGASFRVKYGIAGYLQFKINDQLRAGYSYQHGFTEAAALGGTHQVMIGYDINIYRLEKLSQRILF
jgi:type IX secretion system PorP/SprF family membrane protein